MVTAISVTVLERLERLEIAVGKLLAASLGSQEWVDAYAEVEFAYAELE